MLDSGHRADRGSCVDGFGASDVLLDRLVGRSDPGRRSFSGLGATALARGHDKSAGGGVGESVTLLDGSHGAEGCGCVDSFGACDILLGRLGG